MTPLNIPGIPNGYKVDDIIWRGAQPDDAAWLLLAAAGCKAVIDLNSAWAQEQDQRQYDLVTAAGMKFSALHWDGIMPPSPARIRLGLALLDSAAGPAGHPELAMAPVFVHCAHGSDRTGTLCACWRIHHDGWDLDDAMAEALCGLGLQGMHEFWMAEAVARYAHSSGGK